MLPAIRILIILTSLLIMPLVILACVSPTDETTMATEVPTVPPMPTATATPEPTPTQHPFPNLRYHDVKEHALELINDYRNKAGVPPLTMGDNISAQIHAELTLQDCHSSLWSSDGLATEARYSLAGGYQNSNTIIFGNDYCGDREEREFINNSEVAEVVESIFKPEEDWDIFSYGIPETMSDERYSKLNIGLTRDSHYTRMVLVLETDYIDYAELPFINNGVFSLSGRLKNSATLTDKKSLSIGIFYRQPPIPLTNGQLIRVYSSTIGDQIVSLRHPPSVGSHWKSEEYIKTFYECLSPYDASLSDAPPIISKEEADALNDKARDDCAPIRAKETGGIERTIPWVTADKWVVDGNNFLVVADISEVVNTHGDGLYTVSVWGEKDGQDILVSEYTIFYGVNPPSVYIPQKQ